MGMATGWGSEWSDSMARFVLILTLFKSSDMWDRLIKTRCAEARNMICCREN